VMLWKTAGLREEIARASGIVDQYNQTIVEIDHALRRIEAECYEVTEVSAEAIPYERLLLIPWARTGLGEHYLPT
jgi:RNA polymerase-binding transcription factor DksA